MSTRWWLPLFVVVTMLATVRSASAGPMIGAMQSVLVLAAEGEADAGEGEKQSFFTQYFPFGLNSQLTQSVDDIVVPTYLINLIPAGGFWGPLLFLDDRPEMTGDIALAYFVPASIAIAWGLGWGFTGAVLGAFTGGICGLISCIGCLSIIPYCWIAPTASLNAWDWAYKHPGQKMHRKEGGKKGGGKKEGGSGEQKSGGGEAYGY